MQEEELEYIEGPQENQGMITTTALLPVEVRSWKAKR